LAVGERKRPDVGEDRLDLGGDVPLTRDADGPVEHRLGDVRGDVPDPLPGAQAPEGGAATHRYVEHRGARRLPADLRRGRVEPPQVAADARAPQDASERGVLDAPVVDGGPERVVAPPA